MRKCPLQSMSADERFECISRNHSPAFESREWCLPPAFEWIHIIVRDYKLPHSSEFESSFESSLPRAFKWIWIFWVINSSCIQANSNIPRDQLRANSNLPRAHSPTFESPARSIPPAFERIQIARTITFELIRISRAITLPYSSEFESPAQSLFRIQSNLNFSRIQISRTPSPASTLILAVERIRIIVRDYKLSYSSEFEISAQSLSLSLSHSSESLRDHSLPHQANSNLPRDLTLPCSSEFESLCDHSPLERIRISRAITKLSIRANSKLEFKLW